MDIASMQEGFAERWGEEKGGWCFRVAASDNAFCPDQSARVRAAWEGSGDFDGFLSALKEDRLLARTSQAWAEIAKAEDGWDFLAPHGPWPLVCEVADGDWETTCMCDAGSVKVGDLAGTGAVKVSNRWGDGECRVLVFDAKRDRFDPPLNMDAFESQCVIEGDFQIYPYDCAALSPAEDADLSGSYFCLSAPNTVAFVRM